LDEGSDVVVDIKGEKLRVEPRHRGLVGSVYLTSKEKGRNLRIPMRAVHEAAASTLDDLLEFGVVPPTYIREYKAVGQPEVVSLQTHINHGMSAWDAAKKHVAVNNDDLIKITILDFILDNTDRHGENLLVDENGRAFAIDNEATLGACIGCSWAGVGNKAFGLLKSKKIPVSVLKSLQDLEYADFVTALAGVDKRQVDAAWKRKQLIEKWIHIPPARKFHELWMDHRAASTT
jgi:hypothetical protein